MTVSNLSEISWRCADELTQGGHFCPVFDEEGLSVHADDLSGLLSNVNSDARTHDVDGLRCNEEMDNKTIRRLNLHGLIDEFGTIESLARATGTVANYLSQIKGGSREMGDAVARKMEQRMAKERGWMDSPHFASTDATMSATEALQILEALSPEDRESRMKHGRLLVEGNGRRGPSNPFGKIPRGG
jgi:hypothetical protein